MNAEIRDSEFSLRVQGLQFELRHTRSGYDTCARFVMGLGVQYKARCLDEQSMSVFEVSENSYFSEEGILDGTFPILIDEMDTLFGEGNFDFSKPFQLYPAVYGIRIPAVDSFFTMPVSYAWVMFDIVDGEFKLVDQALAYDEPGIVIGTRSTRESITPPELRIRINADNDDVLALEFDADPTLSYSLLQSTDTIRWRESGVSMESHNGVAVFNIKHERDSHLFFRLLAQ